MSETRKTLVMYEVTETVVTEIDEPDGSFAELLAAVRNLAPEHAYVRILNWYTPRPA